MNELYDLREMLCNELKNYGRKHEMSSGTLDVVDKLAHALKNLDKVIKDYENGSYDEYEPYNDGSYARGRGSRRSSYSYNSDMVDRLRGLMDSAPDERTRHEMQKMISRMESM